MGKDRGRRRAFQSRASEAKPAHSLSMHTGKMPDAGAIK